MTDPPSGDRALLVEHDVRVATLLADAEAACGPVAWPRVQALITALVELYGRGLERLVALARDHAVDGDAVDGALAADELIASLLLVHDIHPVPLEERLVRALAEIGRDLPEAAPLELGEVDGGILVVRPSRAAGPVPTTAAVAHAVERAAPELTGVRVDASLRAASGDGLVSIERLVRGGRP